MPKVYKKTPSPTDETKTEVRCDDCNKLIIRVSKDFEGDIEIVCPRCNRAMTVIVAAKAH